MMQTSHRTWEKGKDVASTTWGTNWDYYSAANYVIIILDPKPCWILEILIVIGLSSIEVTFVNYQTSES